MKTPKNQRFFVPQRHKSFKEIFFILLFFVFLVVFVSFTSAYSESFETDFGRWTADYYLQCEFDKPPCWPLEWDIKRSTEQAYDGVYSLRGYLNGDHDDGTIWVERIFEAPVNSNFNVEISFYLWSESYSDFNGWPVLAYVGLNDPEEEIDFNLIGRTDEVVGWKKYSYSTQVKTDSNGVLWVAFGFGVTWEVGRIYYMDLVNIRIESCDSGCLDKNNICLPIGTRTPMQYCDINGNFLNQKSLDSNCQNDFECLSGKCSNGKCVDLGVIFDQNEEKTSQIQDLIGFKPQEIPPGPVGDSSGGSSTGSVRTTKTFSSIKANTLTSVSSTTGAVDNIAFKLKNNQRDVNVKITRLSTLPSVIGKIPQGKIYEFFEININIDNSIFFESKIKFKVSNDWLNKNGVSKNNIILQKYKENWVKLNTKFISSDSLYSYFEANTDGFSIFGITSDVSDKKQVGLCGNGVIDSDENCRSCSFDVKCQSDETCDEFGICQRKTVQPAIQQAAQPSVYQSTKPKEGINLKDYITSLVIGIVILVLLIVAIIIYLIAIRKPKTRMGVREMSEVERRNYERLKNITEEKIEQGYSKEQVKQAALNSGWDERLIDEVMKYIK